MDVTRAFRAEIKKAGGPPQILPKVPAKNLLVEAARGILTGVTSLRSYLLEFSNDYMQASRHFKSKTQISEKDRDAIEVRARVWLDELKTQINGLKETVLSNESFAGSRKAHYLAIILTLTTRLQGTADLFNQQRSVRLERAMESTKERYIEAPRTTATTGVAGAGVGRGLASVPPPSLRGAVVAIDEDESAPGETQRLEQENAILQNSLVTQLDQARRAEMQMLEISALMNTFTNEVVRQSQEIEDLYAQAVNSTENIKAGNQQLDIYENTTKKFNINMLLFLIISAFSLLFLNWYSD